MNRRHVLLATALSILPMGALAQGTDVTILYTAASPFVAIFVAQDERFFAANGVNATLHLAQNGSVIVSGVVSGSAQVGLPTPTVVMQAVENGLDSGTLNVVEFALPQTADVLRGGQMDAVATLDPFLTRAVDSGAGTFIGNYTDVITPGSTAGVVTVMADWAEANPDAVAGIQRALDQAAAFVQTNPDRARAAIAHYTTLPPPVVANVAFPNLSNLHLTPDSFAFWQDLALEQGLISAPVDLDRLIIPFAGN